MSECKPPLVYFLGLMILPGRFPDFVFLGVKHLKQREPVACKNPGSLNLKISLVWDQLNRDYRVRPIDRWYSENSLV